MRHLVALQAFGTVAGSLISKKILHIIHGHHPTMLSYLAYPIFYKWGQMALLAKMLHNLQSKS